MRSVRKARSAGLVAMVTAGVLLAAPAAWAATISITDLTTPGFMIGAEVRKAVFGIDMTDGSGTATFDGLSIELADVGGDGDFDLTNLEDLQASPDGVAVYRDDGTADDELDADDTRVSTGFTNAGGSVDIVVDSVIPAASEELYTYFLTVQTSSAISNGDDFTVEIPSVLLGCAFTTSPATSFLGCPSGTSQTITADTVAPTASLASSPTTIGGNVVWAFSEDVVGVSTSNVVLRLDGSSTNIPAAVTYDSVLHKATINPSGTLSPGETYDSIVNPDEATDLVTDQAGNPVALTSDSFSLDDFGFTPGVVRGNTWYLGNDFDGDHDILAFGYGSPTDFPVVGDWDGNGTMTPGVVRGNTWYLNNGFDASHDILAFGYGSPTDFPVVGDWDGDGDWTPGVVRGNTWYLNNGFDASHDILAFGYGSSTDFPVVGDWDGDGDATPGVVRGNTWYLNNGFDTGHDIPAFGYGSPTDFPVVGDWDGDGDVTPGVVRGITWYLNNGFDTGHDIAAFGFGNATDFPLVGDWDASIGP